MDKDFEAVILSACRTPIGAFGGALKDMSAVELGAIVIREAIARAGVPPADIGDAVMGCVLQAGAGMNVARVAARYKVSRADQDAFAAESQARAERAIAEGRFKDEIVPVPVPTRKGEPVMFDTDEYPRAGTTAEKLGGLKPAFKKDGTVTAGN